MQDVVEAFRMPENSVAPFLDARRATIAVQIYSRLRQQVVAGTLRPMQCLSEKDLAASLGVSRTPVREALGKLEEDGLVQIRPQYGTFVTPILPAMVSTSQFIRESLECAGVREAALAGTEADRDRLRAVLADQRLAATEAAFFEADDAMHRLLFEIAGQADAWRVVHTAKAVIDRVRYLSVQRVTKRKSILLEHKQIVERVCAADPDGASDAMRVHLRGVFTSTEQIMQQHPEYFADARGPRPNRHRTKLAGAVR